MQSNIISGIVRINRPDGKTAGTGFVVSDRLIATCAHVIPPGAEPKSGMPPEKVELVFRKSNEKRSAHVVAEWWRPADAGDVAFLKLDEALPEGVRPLLLGSSLGSNDHAFQTFGFPAQSPEEGIWGDGHILNETLQQGMRVLQISSPQATPGFSGAPVMDEVNRRVVGMVTSITRPDTYGRMAETAFVTPTETLRMVCPELQLKDVQPYLGLAAFSESDAEFFFGRKREVERLVESLRREPRFLAVLGPSGSGKSSVIQAGLIPEMRRARVPGSDRWGIITARPGDQPLKNLDAKGLSGAASGLKEAEECWLNKNPDKIRLMLILDQFEELFATASPEVQKDFLIQLEGLLQSDLPITLMLAMRDDFFSRFAKEAPPGLFEWVQRGFVHISAALEEGELREIIEGPAAKVGLQFEAGLEEAIVKDVLETTTNGERAGRSTVLPLLEFALTQLWERRSDGFLTHEAYSKIGGVTGSLTMWADQAYQSLAKDGLGDMARRVLTELVNPGDERQNLPDSRRRRSLQDICAQESQKEAVHRVVQRLADARLVTTSFNEQSKQETVEIIHDSLIREWARLRQWLKEDRSFLAWMREIEKKTDAWAEGKRDEGRLVRGLDLSEAQRWHDLRSSDIGQKEQEYIQASLALQERERAEKQKIRRRWMKGLAAFSAIALVLSVMAVFEWNQADQKTEEALALYLTSQSEQIKAASGSDYARQVLLAVESLRHKETADGDLALRSSMALLARPLAQLDHNSSVQAVAFSPDGTKVLTGSFDKTARIWDVTTGLEVHKLNHDGTVYAVAFSPDGTKVLTGSFDKTAWIWPVSDKDLIEQACGCMPENLSIEQWGRYPISDIRTCPKEGQFNQSALTRFLNDPKGFLTGSDECQPCIAEAFRNRK